MSGYAYSLLLPIRGVIIECAANTNCYNKSFNKSINRTGDGGGGLQYVILFTEKNFIVFVYAIYMSINPIQI